MSFEYLERVLVMGVRGVVEEGEKGRSVKGKGIGIGEKWDEVGLVKDVVGKMLRVLVGWGCWGEEEEKEGK